MGMGSTKKLLHAVSDLKGLVNDDMSIQTERDARKATNEILMKIHEKLKKTEDYNNIDTRNLVEKKLRRVFARSGDRDLDFDIFGNMDFPEKSEFPVEVSLNTLPTTPAVLKPDFVHGVEGGPPVEILNTPTPTTDLDQILLDPKDFGYTTTHKPIAVFGDVEEFPSIPPIYLTTTKAPMGFEASFKNEMKQYGMGAFSIAMLKIFDMGRSKEKGEVIKLGFALARQVDAAENIGDLDEFGEPTKHAIMKSTAFMANAPYDHLKAQAILLHNALIHRRELFSLDLNSIMDYMDSLYTHDETEELIQSMVPLHTYNNVTRIPYTRVKVFMDKLLAPWKRLRDSPKREILKEALIRGLRNHLFPDEYSLHSRRNKPTAAKDTNEGKPVKVYINSKRKEQFKDNVTSKEKALRRNIAKLQINPSNLMVEPLNLDIKLEEKANNSINLDEKKIMTNVKSDDVKRLLLINKKGGSTRNLDKDQGLVMSSAKRHHAHQKHSHKHRHKRIKHRLKKILNVIKRHKGHKRRKSKKRHHRHNRHINNLRASIYTETNHTENKISKPIDMIVNKTTVRHYYQHTTQVYEIRDKVNPKRRSHQDVIRQASPESDDEVVLKVNLYKAMAVNDDSEELSNFET
ncbi:uncharacterized protein LOC132903546 [Amyelois transitella]|uniref:uncharacterized protein LOC132903546 n=1 Tax=Amyelois transitella TaxID=680683 RepID=UPI00298FD184|nr:uncharacterized protein LOC132903546 [Amyelois transitella]